MAVQWPDQYKDRFLIKMEGLGDDISGYAFASISDIVGMVSENAQATAIDECEPHIYQVWRLDDAGIVPATVTVDVHRGMEMSEVIVTWREPGGSRRPSESGFYPIR